MKNEFSEDYQYNSCISRGICSINPRTSALQYVMVLYLRIFAKYLIGSEVDNEIKCFILNTLSITIYNPEFNENSFLFAVNKFKENLPKIIKKYFENNPNKDMEIEKNKAIELFENTSNITDAIKYGEKSFKISQEKIPANIRDMYNIMLVISKSLSINLLDLESFDKNHNEAFESILELLSSINIEEKDFEKLKGIIIKSAKIDLELMELLRSAQEERYGTQKETEVSYTTTTGKAVLVVGSNIRELETVLESLKDEDIDVYTHDDMMIAHTFPKFSEYKSLKGQFGQGVESCLLDFAVFPGPIILTKHSLHNIENFYRGRLYTTDYTTSPKGIIKIENNDYSKVIETAKSTKGFKKGKQCESVNIGYDYENVAESLKAKLDSQVYDKIFIITPDGSSMEQKSYFEKLVKLAPKNVLIVSFSYYFDKENVVYINSCFDNYSWVRFFEFLKIFELPITVFVPKCDRASISQMIYLSINDNVSIYLGQCTPIILNPALMNTLQTTFSIKGITTAKKDLEQIFGDK